MTTEIPKIEFICTANCGRSEPSRIIAREHLYDTCRDDIYEAISSGTSVQAIADFKAGINRDKIPINRSKY
jgi:protein-tyrosine-phosphatase